MSLARWHVHLEPAKPPVIVVNGADVSELFSGVRCVFDPPGLPQLVLIAQGEVELGGEGVVQVGQDDEIAATQAFLDSVDPEELDRRSLEQYPEASGPGDAMLRTLREFLRVPAR